MIFVYEKPQRMSFWMLNTSIPLDVGFFDSHGVLREIHPLIPHDRSTVASRASNLRFALEVPRGWFASKQIQPGAQLNLRDLREALLGRGFTPERYGL